MAKWLGLPVILVVDAYPMARSAAALVQGFREFDPQVKIAGVIFNRVAGEGHFRILADAVKGTRILGWLPVNAEIEIPERHLGLMTAKEELTRRRIEAVGAFVERHVDIDRLLESLDQHHPGASRHPSSSEEGNNIPTTHASVRVAIAQDKAFSFYYRANRIALADAGAEIIEFSPLADREVPEADFLYLGGGYPELYRNELETNARMRASIRQHIESGRKFYAECGGLMYLAESIDGAQMVGIVPTQIHMTDRLVDFGYCEVTTIVDSILGPAGTAARGHQFHYSRTSGARGDGYRIRQGLHEYSEGFFFPNGIASYVHLHFLSNPVLARNMLNS